MLMACFDDSGSHDQSDVIVFGGLIGNDAIWTRFETEWKAKLAVPLPGKPRLQRFHMAKCMAQEGEFSEYSEAEADAATHDFRQIIIASGAWGYAVGVSRRDWRQLIVPPASLIFGDDEAYCFRDCVAKMLLFVDSFSPNDRELSLVFDNRPHRTPLNERIYRQYQALPQPHNARLLGVSFLDSVNFIPLQAADMFAWEFYTHARRLLTGPSDVEPRPHAKQFFDTGRFFMGLVDRATCEKIVNATPIPQP
jgi:hypothetical protein